MSRPLRIQYPDAWYHVMNRGRRGEKVFEGKNDYNAFIENSTISSIDRRLKREMIRDKKIKRTVEALKFELSKGQE